MNQSANQDTLKLRGRLVSSHQIPVTTTDLETFTGLLDSTIAKAPGLFRHAPVVLDFTSLPESPQAEITDILNICRTALLVPYAITDAQARHQQLIEDHNLAWLEYRAGNASNTEKVQPAPVSETQVIRMPVRSGQQVYARNANLVIMNQVSAGAEVIADGNIHIFGTLRGRAIAGAQGNAQAEIICQQMKAELISIAGTYIVQDDFPDGEGGAHCTLSADSIAINYL